MAARDDHFMELALELAREGGRAGAVPVGAVIVAEGRLVGWGHNTRHTTGDILGHAELVALQRASVVVGDWRVARSTLYVTLEPCMMCVGALLQARVERIVFGCRDPKAGAVRSLFALAEDPRLPYRARVHEGILADEAGALLREFFERLRQEHSL